jgi:hypothetical protein
MALLPLASITKMSDMRAYVNAERNVAASKCPGAYGDYSNALDILDTYSTFEGTALELTYVELAREAIYEARKTWYAIGCPDPKTFVPESTSTAAAAAVVPAPPLTTPATQAAVAPGGNLAKILLAGGALFVMMMVFAKDKSKKRAAPKKRKAVKRKRTRKYSRRKVAVRSHYRRYR